VKVSNGFPVLECVCDEHLVLPKIQESCLEQKRQHIFAKRLPNHLLIKALFHAVAKVFQSYVRLPDNSGIYFSAARQEISCTS